MSSLWSPFVMSYVQNSTSGCKYTFSFWTPTEALYIVLMKMIWKASLPELEAQFMQVILANYYSSLMSCFELIIYVQSRTFGRCHLVEWRAWQGQSSIQLLIQESIIFINPTSVWGGIVLSIQHHIM